MSTARGRQAELVAADFLLRKGLAVIAQNWRTRWCEIDIVAHKKDCVYFVEVKYRGSNQWGSGLDYLTPRKLQQMQFAAEFWMATHTQKGGCKLSAIALAGEPPQVTAWLDDIETS